MKYEVISLDGPVHVQQQKIECVHWCILKYTLCEYESILFKSSVNYSRTASRKHATNAETASVGKKRPPCFIQTSIDARSKKAVHIKTGREYHATLKLIIKARKYERDENKEGTNPMEGVVIENTNNSREETSTEGEQKHRT